MTGDKAVMLACVIAVPLVLSCEARAFDAGWKLTRAPLAVPAQVIEVANATAVCGIPRALGCYMPMAGTIFLQAGMAAADRACVLRHEQAHAGGWDHGPDSTLTARPSCGPV